MSNSTRTSPLLSELFGQIVSLGSALYWMVSISDHFNSILKEFYKGTIKLKIQYFHGIFEDEDSGYTSILTHPVVRN